MAAAGFKLAVAAVTGNKRKPSERGRAKSNRRVKQQHKYDDIDFIDNDGEDEEPREEEEEAEEEKYHDGEGPGEDDETSDAGPREAGLRTDALIRLRHGSRSTAGNNVPHTLSAALVSQQAVQNA
jgi:hypothetical protein